MRDKNQSLFFIHRTEKGSGTERSTQRGYSAALSEPTPFSFLTITKGIFFVLVLVFCLFEAFLFVLLFCLGTGIV